MSYCLIVKPLAEKDIEEIYSWYNQQRVGLGDIFLTELERSFDFIEKGPAQYQVRYKEVRMTQIKSFPICVHYTIEEDTILFT
ncbi:type II toxin-antitoxin system RelE/ParE family toxin [Chryseosolibacter indicus]|uniref:Type II toxin-antitoxin system RelE/ParE family toxin n=1 Tax=Chryseosolibacter indicus TaxID=2782351 RepID=A0ABS5VU14_9BACT|nr:type II toxin-antitoxin system RelE/ParE family toxin [Chryseosolibacter indicus]